MKNIDNERFGLRKVNNMDNERFALSFRLRLAAAGHLKSLRAWSHFDQEHFRDVIWEER